MAWGGGGGCIMKLLEAVPGEAQYRIFLEVAPLAKP